MLGNLKLALAMVVVSAAFLSVQNAVSAEDDKPVDTTKPDNTKTNTRDRNDNELTAGSQKQNKSDIDITAKIRKAVVGDTTLSINAHNIKIITVDGMVTLKGPVKSEAEKTAIEKCAVDVVSQNNVKSQIDIAP